MANKINAVSLAVCCIVLRGLLNILSVLEITTTFGINCGPLEIKFICIAKRVITHFCRKPTLFPPQIDLRIEEAHRP